MSLGATVDSTIDSDATALYANLEERILHEQFIP